MMGKMYKNNPPAAKADGHFDGCSGTTKVVPFQNGGSVRVFRNLPETPDSQVGSRSRRLDTHDYHGAYGIQ
jgi:hypothetical protein